MSKEGVIYSSGVERRTEAIIRAFCAKNGITFAQFHNMIAHIIVANQEDIYDIKGRMNTLREKFGLSDELTYYNPLYEQFDQLVREFMLKNTPEDYRKLPFVKRMFGNIFKPLTRREVEEVERALAKEEGEKAEEPELPPANVE